MKYLALLLLLAGCSESFKMEKDARQCAEFGYREGTRENADCRMTLKRDRSRAYDDANVAYQLSHPVR